MIFRFNDFQKYRTEIIRLWRDCFGDDETYIDNFLNNINDAVCIAEIENTQFISMLFLIDCKINNLKSKYLYAACTDKKYRKHGIMKSLIDNAIEFCRNNSYDTVFLVPATEKLYEYYAKFGFSDYFYKQSLCMKSSESEYKDYNENDDVNDYVQLHNELTRNINSFSFYDNNLIYSFNEHILNGGKFISIRTEAEIAYAFYFISENNVIIKEFLSSKALKSSIFSILIQKYNAENVYILCPLVYNNKDTDVVCTKCGMAYPLTAEAKHILENGQPYYAAMYLD